MWAAKKAYMTSILLAVLYFSCCDSCCINPPDCHGLNGISYGSFRCSDGYSHGSRCTYSCSRGFTICPGKKYCFTCDCEKWKGGPINPQCCDVEAPTLTCPSSITKRADPLRTSSVVKWSPPIAQDNSGITNVRLTTSKPPESTFTEGSHRVCYEVSDPTGHKGSCCFTVTITVDRCDSPNEVDHQTVNCNDPDYKPGTTCLFSCDPGWCLDGNSQWSCNNQGYWSVEQPICTPMECPPLTQPDNGYIVHSKTCSTSIGGECAIACNDGYRLSNSNALRFCQIQVGSGCTGSWSGQDGDVVCNRVMCPVLNVSHPASITGCSASTEEVPSGTTCQLQCPYGYRGTGHSYEAVCSEDGIWSNGDFQCEEITCASLQEVHPAYHSGCNKFPGTDEVGASCQWQCRTGHTHSSGADNSTCQPDGTWDFNDFTCSEILCSPLTANPPIILECRGSGDQFPFGTLCQWSCQSGYRGVGSVTSTCLSDGTWDSQEFVCEDITCNSLDEPYPSYHDGCNKPPDGKDAVADSCQWYCRSGFYGTGPDTSTCQPDGTWDVLSYTCQAVQCDPLGVPDNGAMACDTTANVRFCYINCRDGFDIPRSVIRDDKFQQPYVCRDGDWEETDYVVPNCEGTRSPNHLLVPVDLYYYANGPCSDENTIQEIKDNFEALIRDSIYTTEYCQGREGNCDVQNVEVFCGNTRKRRDSVTIINNWKSAVKQTTKEQKRLDALRAVTHRQKRSKTKLVRRSSSNELTVSFDLTMTFNPDPEADMVDESWDAVDDIYYMVDELYVMAENNSLVPDVAGMVMSTRLHDGYPMNYWDEEVSPECEPGYVEATESVTCSPCFLGTYSVNGNCEGCPIGSYQDEKAKTECKSCPEGMSTIGTGSQDITDCKTICLPGQNSTTGLVPCTNCSVGSYQPLGRSTRCVLCPDGQSTIQSGCQSQTDCIDICLPGEMSSTGMVPCTACPHGFYQPYQMVTECLPCPEGQNTTAGGSQMLSDCREHCSPGSWSSSGLTPCFECEANSYQTWSGQTECTPCPENTGTLLEPGANSTSQCVVTHCSVLPVGFFTNGVFLQCDDLNAVGSNCTLLCQKGYELRGVDIPYTVCQGDGTWSAAFAVSFPRCEVKNCSTAAPPLPAHAYIDTGYMCSNQYGSNCTILCEAGYILRGSRQATCEYNSETKQTYWFWDQEPYCLGKDQTCPPLPEPWEGFWSCIDRRSVCNLRCNRGRDVRKGDPTVYRCSNGVWEPPFSAAAAVCKYTSPSKEIKQTSDAKFTTTDNCTDVDMVREGVYTYLSSTFYGEECQDKCIVEDVEVSCEEGPESDRRRKRQEPQIEYSMDICFTLKTDVNETATAVDIAEDADALSFITKKISREIQDGIFNAYVGGMSVQVVPVNGKPLDIGEIEQTCPDGYTEAATTLTCIACDEDTFEMNGECHPCPDDQYQPQKGQTSCIVPDT